jgi:hypothetical protein
MSDKKIPFWVQQRKQKIDNELEYFTIPQGETKITVDVNVVPTERDGKYSKQYTYAIMTNGTAYKLSASEYLDRIVIEALSQGINPFTLVREGTGKKTKYSIKELA